MENLTKSLEGFAFFNKKWEKLNIKAPKEIKLQIYINNSRFVSILATPHKLKYLVIGFLFAEGIINNLVDITDFKIDNKNYIAYIQLKKNIKLPDGKILTSGFGKGTMFKTEGTIV